MRSRGEATATREEGAKIFSPALHHRHELLEIDLTVPVRVHLLNHARDLLRRHDALPIIAAQDRREFLLRDLPASVPIEDPEGGPADVLLDVGLLIDRGGKEL